MNGILTVSLVLCFLIGPAAPADEPAEKAAPVAAVVAGDWVDLGLVLGDPGIETRIVDAWSHGDVTVLTAVHRRSDGSEEACVWIGFYTFPSTIFAHSVVNVPMHADEME